MASHREHLAAALFHAKTTRAHLVKALVSLGVDDFDDDGDEPVESGLIEPSPPDDVPDSGFLPALFDKARARYMRLVD